MGASPLQPALIQDALQSYETMNVPALPGRSNNLHAAILVPLFWPSPEDGPETVLTVRPQHLSSHGGEVCFPGGRRDPEDQDLTATALRESWEELGIQEANVLGQLSSIPLYTSEYRVFPFVAQIPNQKLEPSPDEVERVLHFSIPELLARPSIDAIPYEVEGFQGMAPVFVTGRDRVFGATALVLWELLQVLAPLAEQELPTLEPGRFSWENVLSEAAGSTG